MKYLLWFLKALLFLAFFVFAFGNRQLVPLHLLPDSTLQLPLVVILFCSFMAGVLAGIAVMVPRWWRYRQQARQALLQSQQAQAAQQQQAAAPTPAALAPDNNRHMTDPALPLSEQP